MSENIPLLVKNDPWLEPYTDHIHWRMTRLQDHLQEIEKRYGNLATYASAHQYVGIHYRVHDDTWSVREWAPGAKSVSLVGEFNQWNKQSHPLVLGAQGVWETHLPGETLKHKDLVKLHIVGADDSARDRIPACIQRAVQDETSKDYSGQVWQPEEAYVWQNDFDPSTIDCPLIYECHVGMSGEEPRIHSYREFADEVLPRICALGYNTIQLMAVQEHPYYGSFGYHVSSFFAACSRFGTPEDLKYLIDQAHGMNIAVLLDIVHSHAVKNIAEGLNEFDGTDHQYFHSGERGDQPQWDSKCFDYGKDEVRQFLLSNTLFWIDEFRFDGFRFDGVTSMLYHHHGSVAFDHYDKYFTDGPDEDAILYLGMATTLINQLKPGCIVVAEDMSGMPGLCRPTSEGGIGFTHRLAMGIPDYWIKLLKHKQDEDWAPEEIWNVMSNRRFGEANIAYAESHDQALVGDKTIAFRLMDKEMYWHMNIDDEHPVIERGIALHKIIRLFTLVSGGEGWLNFMGNEFGHPEWLDFPREGNDWSSHYCRRQWSLVDNPELRYQHLNAFDSTMIHLTKKHHLLACNPAQMLSVHNADQVLAAERGNIIFVFNLNPQQSFPDYHISMPGNVKPGDQYRLVLDSDSEEHGGHCRLDPSATYTVNEHHQLSIYIPSRTCIALERI
ncbi:alpha amylase C-terminal domain-containing protein [Oceaniferula flava]|nr:alpha amylase C-terminal domain-containing protein [Oceaniferula flavus]